MENKDMLRKAMAGLFFLIGIFLFSVVVLVIGVEKGLTQPKFHMTVVFHEVGGLSIGAPVALSGVHVGTVSDIYFLDKDTEGRHVAVQLNIFKKFEKQLVQSERFSIKTEGILGEKFVDISTSDDIVRADLGKPVIGEDPINVQDLAITFADTADAMMETSDLLNDMLKQMESMSDSTKRLLRRLEQQAIDGKLFRIF